MPDQAARASAFLALHHGEKPLLLPNPWDVGSARLLASMGFTALATTSSGHAATLGRLDGRVTREEAFAHASELVAATDLPVSADLENGFSVDAAGVAETVLEAIEIGLAGCSVEDYSGPEQDSIYEPAEAADRVAAAAEAAHSGRVGLVLTARAENFIHQRPDLDDTISRLQSFQEAGADVLYAPGVTDAGDVRRLVESVDLPINVLALPGTRPVAELGELGVKRVSVGGAFSLVALGAVADAAREFLIDGTYGYWQGLASAIAVRDAAFE